LKRWNQLLADARKRVRLTQRDLAALTLLSPETIKAYEMGRRRATRPRLIAMLDAINIDQHTRNDILAGAGFATESIGVGRRSASRYLSIEEAVEQAELRPWPAFVVNELVEVLGMNDAGRRLWGLAADRFDHPVRRNILTLATDPTFAAHFVNWDDAVGGLVALLKAHWHRAESLDAPSSYFAAVLEYIDGGDAGLVERFRTLWEYVPAYFPEKVAWTYPIVWSPAPGADAIKFLCLSNSANEDDAFDIDDWMPADAQSFRRLQRLLKASRRADAAG
jgi:transcriptional regulator with XRE-family HTH domain